MRNPLDLVIVTGDDLEQGELDHLMANWHATKQATDLLCQGLISLSDFEDILDDSGVDVEEYSQQVEENAIILAY